GLRRHGVALGAGHAGPRGRAGPGGGGVRGRRLREGGRRGVPAVTRERTVDRARPAPLYHQLETLLRRQILAGRWAAGERIPTEEQLVEAYGVSRVTVRQALRNLVLDGYLERGPGRGTFVRKPTLTAGERGLTSFTQDMGALGLRAGARLV